jgi:hypothetical protein
MHDKRVFQFAEWDTGALAYAKLQKTDEVARMRNGIQGSILHPKRKSTVPVLLMKTFNLLWVSRGPKFVRHHVRLICEKRSHDTNTR